MVAYNFKSAFHQPIIDRTKQQTVRARGKKRHARPGERVQIYKGLRTKNAAKLIPDPICTRVDMIIIPVGPYYLDAIGRIEINGVPLETEEMEAFARADGFPSLKVFGRFWLSTHGEGLFHGVVIHWGDG